MLLRVVLLFTVASLLHGAPLPALEVLGNKLVWLQPQPYTVQLKGVTGTGALFSCIANRSMFDGPIDAHYMAAMKTWSIDIIRVPLNEDCWLGIDGVSPSFSGAAYRSALVAYVSALVEYGFYVILDLHWTSGGLPRALQQRPMPGGNSITFWQGVAATFKSRPGHVLFDVFNEPYPDSNRDTTKAWRCWKHGGSSCPDLNYTAVGMDALLVTVRGTGATNIVMLGGVCYSNSLSQWLTYAPSDPLKKLAASWHSYNFNSCNNPVCWEATVGPVTEHVPVITGELGEDDCGGTYITPLMAWLDTKVTSYLAWLWAPWNCDKGPALITSYDGVCTQSYGCTYKAHIAASANRTSTSV